MTKWSKAANEYRDLYQKKLSPQIPFSNAALKEEVSKKSASVYKDFVLGKIFILWIKAFFGQVEDQELKLAQSKARRTLLCTLLYMIAWFLVAAMILYFSNRT